MAQTLQAVREAAIDGRMHNVICRQLQLESLQRTLFGHANAIEQAISKDSGHSANEAFIEYLLAMNNLNAHYQSLDFKAALKDEYAALRNEDREERHEPFGIVYIVPTSYTLFYSVIVAVSAAIAAGNCVVIELQNTLKTVPPLLRTLLKSSLDHSIIEFVSSRASDEDLGPRHIRLYQEESDHPLHTTGVTKVPLSSPSSSRTIAVVDQTADLLKAAEALVTARFSFSGNSPYAPDIVFVNEFVKEPFLVAVMNAAVKITASLSSNDLDKHKRSHGNTQELGSLVQGGTNNDGVNVISSLGRGKILEVTTRKSPLLSAKVSGRNLVIHSVRSLDDAIDLSNSDQALLGLYLFSDVGSAKYLSQFIESRVSFINQIPIEILVGPCSPENTKFNRSLRYPGEIFSMSRLEYITKSSMSESLYEAITGKSRASIVRLQSQVSSAVDSASRTAARRSAEGRIQVGFFEQGVFTGLTLFSVPILVGLGTLGYFGVGALLKYRWRV